MAFHAVKCPSVGPSTSLLAPTASPHIDLIPPRIPVAPKNQFQDVPQPGFGLIHLILGQGVHSAGGLVAVETGAALQIVGGGLGQPAGFSQIDFAAHSPDLGGEWRHDDKGSGIFRFWDRQYENGTAFFGHPQVGKSDFASLKAPRMAL